MTLLRRLPLLPFVLALACGDDPVSTSGDATDRAFDAQAPADAGAARDAEPSSLDAEAPDAALPDASDPVDSGPAFADAEPPCARDDAGRCALLSWTATAAFPVALDHHTTFVASSTAGDFVHVVGGVRNRGNTVEALYADVRRARIDASGALGAWEAVTPLPFPKAFHAQVVHEGFVYLLAGVTGDDTGVGASISVLYGRIDGSGSVRDWRTARQLPAVVRVHATAAVAGPRIYLIGGSSDEALDTVTTATLSADGSIGRWTSGPALPSPRSHHATATWGGRVYLVGGFGIGQAQANAVLASLHAADGSISGWEEVGTIADAPWTHSAFVHRDHLYVAGGGQGAGFFSAYQRRIRRAPLDASGRLGAFEDVAAELPRARSHVHQTPYFRGHVYSIGGRRLSGLVSLDEWTVGTFE